MEERFTEIRGILSQPIVDGSKSRQKAFALALMRGLLMQLFDRLLDFFRRVSLRKGIRFLRLSLISLL